MTDTVIRASDLGKKYVLKHTADAAGHRTFRETVTNVLRGLPDKLVAQNKRAPKIEEFWALKNVNFEIKRGDRVGIIGPNGSGKSTLLKMLSRIVEPTEGEIQINGRLASLLEVGTGFHPELSGRENIFLNGAILGMPRNEIQRKYDQIVEFAEVERFLDTPVKRYSSGMYVKLAFSVAAHLEPDIIVVDEVLAVGDLRFQRKCLGKMEEVAEDGRTVIFVSHNIGTVQALCQRGLLLHNGALSLDDSADACALAYLRRLENASSESLVTREDRGGTGLCRFSHIQVSTLDSNAPSTLVAGSPATLAFELVGSIHADTSVCFTIYDHYGQPITYFDSLEFKNENSITREEGSRCLCEIDELPLLPGRYRINAAIVQNGEYQDDVKGALMFEVEPGIFAGRSIIDTGGHCSVLIKHRWTMPKHS